MQRHAGAGATGLIVLVFGLLKLYAQPPSVGDDGIYFYLASRMADGALPYRDFFHGHPPLHLTPLALLLRLNGGYEPWLGVLLPAAAAAGTGLLLYRAASRLGAVEGVLACGVYLLCFDVLRMSSHALGGNLAAFWLAAGFERLARARDVQAAIAVSLGVMTLLNVAPAGAGICLALLLADRARGVRFAVALAACVLLANLLCLAAFGRPFLEQVYLYHVSKPPVVVEGESLYAVVYYNTWLVAGAACGAMLVVADALRRRAGDGTALLGAALGGALGSLAFLLSLERFFTYYLGALFVCMAVLAGAGLAALLRLLRRALVQRDGRAALAAAGLAIPLLLAHLNHAIDDAEPGALQHTHTWVGSGLAPLDAVVKPLLWRADSVEGRRHPGWTHYLWSEADSFEPLAPLLTEVRQRTQPGDAIFGDSTTAPLLALLSGRRLAADAADTNVARMGHGAPALEQLLEELESSPPKSIVVRESRGIHSVRRFRSWLAEHYEPVYRYTSPSTQRTFVLYAPAVRGRGAAQPSSRSGERSAPGP